MDEHIVIEIGTNTIKALLSEKKESGWIVLKDSIFPCRTGAGIISTNQICVAAQLKAAKLIDEIIKINASAGCEIHLIATEGLRRAENAAEFIERVQQQSGLQIQVLSCEEEARLAFVAATIDNRCNDTTLAVLDIGGGSIELIIGSDSEITYQKSMPVGAVKLTERFLSNNPPNSAQMNMLKAYLSAQLSSLDLACRADKLIGMGGTVTTLALLEKHSFSSIDNSVLTIETVQKWIDVFSGRTTAELQGLQGMPEGRADIILAGSLLLSDVMKLLDAKELIVNTKGIRHGYIYTRIQNKQTETLSTEFPCN